MTGPQNLEGRQSSHAPIEFRTPPPSATTIPPGGRALQRPDLTSTRGGLADDDRRATRLTTARDSAPKGAHQRRQVEGPLPETARLDGIPAPALIIFSCSESYYSSMTTAVLQVAAGAEGALTKARDHLLALQHPEGWWKGELETNVTMDAEDLLLREFLGRPRPRRDRALGGVDPLAPAADGSWVSSVAARATSRRRSKPTWRCGWPATRPTARHMRAAAEFARALGGLQRTRVFTHIWLALVRRLAVGAGTGAAAGDDAAARLGAAEPLRLRLLGAPDDRGAVSVVLSYRPVSARCRSRSPSSTGRSRGRHRSAPPLPAGRWWRSTASCTSISAAR